MVDWSVPRVYLMTDQDKERDVGRFQEKEAKTERTATVQSGPSGQIGGWVDSSLWRIRQHVGHHCRHIMPI